MNGDNTTRVGQSWEGHNGVWEKASVEASWDEFPEARPLGDRQRNLYVTCRLRQRLLDMRYMAGGMTADAYAFEIQTLDDFAIGYLNAPKPDDQP